MSKIKPIKFLPVEVQNLIAAGEVIHCPRDILKELLENSIDAGADTVEVTLHHGGIEHISVKDNGVGIERDSLELAISRYATSKIDSFNDMNFLMSFGFRGEALFAISQVCNFSIKSRTAHQSMGNMITMYSPKREVIHQTVPMTQGTHVICDQLFAPIPVRRNFLKNASIEQKKCVVTARAVMLPHLAVSLHMKSVAQILLNVPKGDMLDRLVASFPGTNRDNWHCREYAFDQGKFRAWYCSESLKGLSQLWYCNKRWFQNIQFEKIAQHYIMSGILVTQIELQQIDSVDVNVHPQKHTLHFQYQHSIFNNLSDFFKEWFGQPVSDDQKHELSIKKGHIVHQKDSGHVARKTDIVGKEKFKTSQWISSSGIELFEATANAQKMLEYALTNSTHIALPLDMNLVSPETGIIIFNEKLYIFNPQKWVQAYYKSNEQPLSSYRDFSLINDQLLSECLDFLDLDHDHVQYIHPQLVDLLLAESLNTEHSELWRKIFFVMWDQIRMQDWFSDLQKAEALIRDLDLQIVRSALGA